MTLWPFLLSPTRLLRIVAGRSATRKPRAITPISNSADWYWGCCKLDRGGHLRAHGAHAERRVGDALAGQHADRRGEYPDAELAHRVPGLLAAKRSRSGHEIRVASEHGSSRRCASAGSYWPSASVVTM